MKNKLILLLSVIISILTNVNNGMCESADTNKSKWYIEGGFGGGIGQANSSFDAVDWCNSAGCVDDYWDTFSYPGSDQNTNLGNPTTFISSFKLGKIYKEYPDSNFLSWGLYTDIDRISSAIGVYAESGKKWLFNIGIGIANNSIFDKSALDIRLNLGYRFELSNRVSLIPSIFFAFQWSNNGSATGQGYLDENGTACFNCWAQGIENLYYYNEGIKTTLRYSF